MTTRRFFMIGTWTEGFFHFEKIKSYVVSAQKSELTARVFRLPIGYPVLVEPSPLNFGLRVQGQILDINADETLLALLDSFHGVHPTVPEKSLFQRCVVETDINVYFMNSKKLPKGSLELGETCWKKSIEESPPIPVSLTEKQKDMVKQLGSVKGRDIVLVKDLTIYRDLMKLELIVDKGRRLALSALGKDVYQHLV